MVNLTPPPAGVEDRQVYDYLYQLQEYLRVALDRVQSSAGDAAAQLAEAAAEKAAEASIQQQVQYLQALIIKTANEVEEHTSVDLSNLRALYENLEDVVEGEGGLSVQLLAIQNDYVAQSDFGTYQREINNRLTATETGLTQYINYVSELQANLDTVSADFNAWRVESEGYIRMGIVGYREDTTPIIGIAIGQNLTVLQDATGADVTVEVDGVSYKVVEQKGFRAIYAADELSFWQGDVKVAYMSNNRLYITNVTALSSLNVGRWEITDGAYGLSFKWRA